MELSIALLFLLSLGGPLGTLGCFSGGSFSIGFSTSGGPFVGVSDSTGRGGQVNIQDLANGDEHFHPEPKRKPNIAPVSDGMFTKKPPTELSTSNDGIEFIKRQEGFEETYQPDYKKGIPTIGYGTNCSAHPDLCAQVSSDGKVSRELGESLLKQELTNNVEKSIRANVKVPLTQNQFDALSSFIYHEGVGNFKSSTLLTKLNQRDVKGASEEFPVWNKITDPETGEKAPVQNFIDRRKDEQELFCAGGVCD